MKEKRIRIIIGLMTFAVIGLIAMQIYWLGNLIKVEEERFDRSVFNSLENVVAKIEKEEAKKILVKKVATPEKGNHVEKKDTFEKHFNLMIRDTSQVPRVVKIINDDDEFRWEINSDSTDKSGTTKIKVYGITHGKKVMPPHTNGFFIQHEFDTVIKSKKKLVQNVVAEMMSVKVMQPIEERISVKNLNGQLTSELASYGIDGEFYFGVNKLRKDQFTLLKSGTDPVELKKSTYRVPLFPAEFFAGTNELIVYFPGKSKFIFSSVAGMLILSIGFILLIVGVFYKTVQMFIRQKKITELKNDLINNITHEFKTPISTISLACEALNEPALSAEKDSVSRYSKIIREENDRLQMMVDTLLNTAALEKHEIVINKEEIDIHGLLSDVTKKFEETLKQKKGNITMALDSENHLVKGDKFHLANVFSNMIDNAIKYNERSPEIYISTKLFPSVILISIRDNGIGISKESLSKIFETFYRVQTGNIQNFRGNGIGLSYSKKIIEMHGGKIEVESGIGTGSTFNIELSLR